MIQEVIDRDVEAVLSSLMDLIDVPEDPEPIVFGRCKSTVFYQHALDVCDFKAYGL